MKPIGPHLPPSRVEKRKRKDGPGEDENDDATDISSSRSKSTSPETAAKKPRNIGPFLPPAPLDEKPESGLDDCSESSSDDDGYGPRLPSSGGRAAGGEAGYVQESTTSGPEIAPKTQRDEWMIVPPSNSDWSSRVDPTKLRNRKFNTGKGAKGRSQDSAEVSSKWTETPAEKEARLKREMMGIKDTTSLKLAVDDSNAAATSKKLREYTEKSRGSTLYKEHQKSNPKEKEDDPSARAFDRDKDIAGGMKISHTQRKEMMKKAADMGSRFGSAKYL